MLLAHIFRHERVDLVPRASEMQKQVDLFEQFGELGWRVKVCTLLFEVVKLKVCKHKKRNGTKDTSQEKHVLI